MAGNAHSREQEIVTTVAVTKFGIRPEWREPAYRVVTGLVGLLAAFAYLSKEEAALWTQFGVSAVSLLFAALFATSTLRLVLYPTLVAAGALLTWYGIVTDDQLPLILSAAAQMFGLATASAKVVAFDNPRRIAGIDPSPPGSS